MANNSRAFGYSLADTVLRANILDAKIYKARRYQNSIIPFLLHTYIFNITLYNI